MKCEPVMIRKLTVTATKTTTKMSKTSTRSHAGDLWDPNSPCLRRCFRIRSSCGVRGVTKESVLNLTMNLRLTRRRFMW